MRIEIIHTNLPAKAAELAAKGYEPVECSFGVHGSVLGPLALDHHGTESHREGVAIRAYRDHFGVLADSPRFVVTGDADADATFAIAALCGLLPHPSRASELSSKPSYMSDPLVRDVTDLASLVNTRDTDPFTVKLADHPWGATLLLWQQLATGEEDESGFHAGVDRWRLLSGFKAPRLLLDAAFEQEQERVAQARAATTNMVTKNVGFVDASGFGFDVWYSEKPGTPIVVHFDPAEGQVMVGCRDLEAAERLLGKGGLKNVFARLEPKGWGGRETVGGGPRGVSLSRAQARVAAETIADAVKGR
mgnify:CR=1 FL=1